MTSQLVSPKSGVGRKLQAHHSYVRLSGEAHPPVCCSQSCALQLQNFRLESWLEVLLIYGSIDSLNKYY